MPLAGMSRANFLDKLSVEIAILWTLLALTQNLIELHPHIFTRSSLFSQKVVLSGKS
jgi:hypothetical protein